ncbi:MAG: hypothetical protein PHP14_01420 [Candidatus Pacebacteria bacterium]|nr:hypothetical protein [Candidatus Paceibacterota bacterium]
MFVNILLCSFDSSSKLSGSTTQAILVFDLMAGKILVVAYCTVSVKRQSKVALSVVVEFAFKGL